MWKVRLPGLVEGLINELVALGFDELHEQGKINFFFEIFVNLVRQIHVPAEHFWLPDF